MKKNVFIILFAIFIAFILCGCVDDNSQSENNNDGNNDGNDGGNNVSKADLEITGMKIEPNNLEGDVMVFVKVRNNGDATASGFDLTFTIIRPSGHEVNGYGIGSFTVTNNGYLLPQTELYFTKSMYKSDLCSGPYPVDVDVECFVDSQNIIDEGSNENNNEWSGTVTIP